jgi:4-amino-4-deoxy-L-arabinose transferase-like glycosyltransferase
MFRHLHHRGGHYALLVLAVAGLCLWNLGTPSLWDIDEGHNAEAAREMLAAGNWVVPTFNFQLRTDKPALLYWLQILSYRLFGVGEFAARLPSALAALATVLLTYELGRRMFGAAAGLLAGLVLASTILFCAAAHFANPDALLCALTTASLLVFWTGYCRGGRGWFVGAGIISGLAVLAKGPVGLVLPMAATALFLIWERRLRLLLDRRLFLGLLSFILVALPWYAWVGVETRWEFLKDFFLRHNVSRFQATMEGHHGGLYYYAVCLALGFAPWSAFLVPVAWFGFFRTESAPGRSLPSPYRFLWCWIAVYAVFFSLSATKLPNYILPIYPPLALLTAQFLDRWRRGDLQLPLWLLNWCLAVLALVGIGYSLGVLLVSGALEVPFFRGRRLPGLEEWAILGIIPFFGAAAASWCARRQYRAGLVTCVSAAALLFVATLAATGSVAVDGYKAAKPLVQAYLARQTEPDISVACYRYYQPSMVFYGRREVHRLDDEGQAVAWLRSPLPVYLFVPATVWRDLATKVNARWQVIARHTDLYQGCDVVVVTNKPSLDAVMARRTP